jgi:PIN domain nuclease of toxin-antitoxin system
MKILLDTQMLLWTTAWPELLPKKARQLIADSKNEKYFSPASLWEVVIKSGQNRPDFQVDARVLRRQLLDNGCLELPITGVHTISISDLPPIHKDPFDRLLIAQAKSEGINLLTADATLAEYEAPIVFTKRP